MAKGFNFASTKKQTFPVTLNDEKHTRLMVKSPTKAIMDEFINMNAAEQTDITLDDLYAMCAAILSNNTQGKAVTVADLSGWMDYEDATLFIKAFTEFITEIAHTKN